MAEVDFSHARIAPINLSDSVNPTRVANVSLDYGALYSTSNWSTITTNATRTKLIDQQKQIAFQYQGTFTASGTEFYIGSKYSDYNYGWKVSNISFSSGDTFIFQIKADLICQ